MTRSPFQLFSVVGVLLIGCGTPATQPAESPAEPLGFQMLRTEAQLQKYPFRTLLEFEASTDAVFVNVAGTAKIDAARTHTGTRSLRLEVGAKTMAVKLASLFSGSAFPGRWTLAGAYFYADQRQRLSATYTVDGVSLASVHVEIPARQWTPILLDLTAAEAKAKSPGSLVFAFDRALVQPLWCDDVLVMDNTQTIVETPWVVKERGFEFVIEKPGAFREALKTPEASDQGWALAEASAIRACFSSKGSQKTSTFYADGRKIVDGKMTFLGVPADPAAIEHHQNPGRLTIAPEMGRVDRNSPGDSDNDGYNETTGAYRIVAAAPRIELTLSPGARPLYCPVLEVSGLPAGKVLVNMEGRTVETTARIADQRLLVVVPGTLSRPTLISLRVAQ